MIHKVGIGDALGIDGAAAGSFPKQSQERSDEVGDHAVDIQADQHDDVLIYANPMQPSMFLGFIVTRGESMLQKVFQEFADQLKGEKDGRTSP
jgi:hypothetical protein